jgi:hypothetical protein
VSSSIGARRVEEPPATMGAQMIEPDVPDGSLGVMHIPAPPSREERERRAAEQQRAIEQAEVQRIRERLAYVKNQPLVAVTAADVIHIPLHRTSRSPMRARSSTTPAAPCGLATPAR